MKMKRILSFLLCNMVMFSVFLPSISVQAEEYDSIVTNTTLTPSGNGVDVHLEAYATGDITTIAAITPVDIVLVLDQSSSMKDSLGNSTKQKVLKNVVSNFIDSVAEQFDASTSDHRMSIVTVSNNATVKTNWTFVNDTGKTSLKNSIDSLSASNNSAAMFDKGMEKVKELLGTNYGYSGENTTRYKAVIVFTDGVPSNGNTNSFSTAIADDALELAKAIKDNGATIYSVGLFDGADPYQLYGDVWGYTAFEDIPCSGETGSLWGGSTITSLLTSGVKPVDAPAANRFLNYLSSNFLATSIGITWVTGKNPGNHEIFGIAVTGNGYQITANFPAVKSGYYLVADGADSLNAIFQSISYQIATSNVSLGSDTSIKAVIPETFTLPASAGDVHVYTAAYSGSGNSFAQKVNATGMTVTIDEATRTISVKGFNYKNDFISTAKKADNTYGKKLIIEYHLDTAPGFLGGNNIPLGNILMLDEEGVIAKSFPQTQVNIPIQNVTVTPAVKNVYLNGGISAADLLSGTTAAVGTTALDLTKADQNYGLAEWQTAYVDITSSVINAAGTAFTTQNGLTADTTYSVNVSVAPLTDGSGAAGTAASTKSAGTNAAINVFKPVLTYKDKDVFYGADAPSEYNSCLVSIEWMHGNVKSSDVTMLGTEPGKAGGAILNLTYAPREGTLADGKLASKTDIPVAVTVKIGNVNVTQYVTFRHNDCSGKTCTVPSGYQFLLHVTTGQLTVQSSGGNAGEPYVFTVFKDGERYTEVTIVGNGNVTLYELPAGVYTIQADEDWNWRSTASEGAAVTLGTTPSQTQGTISCLYAVNFTTWLNGFAAMVREIFGVVAGN